MVEKGYIDRELAFDMITDLAGMATTKAAYAAIWKSAKQLNKVPTADVAPVRHGNWVKEKSDVLIHWHCSVCKNCYYLDEPNANYCPNCGAKNGRG